MRQVVLNQSDSKQVNTLKEQSDQLHVVMLLGTLKQDLEQSTTYAKCKLLGESMPDDVQVDYHHLAAMDIAYGVKHNQPDDDMTKIVESINKADVVVFGTPIWWGQPSSLIQKVIERMDSLDLRYDQQKASIGEGKTFGTVIVGAEDGAQGCIQRINGWAPFVGFTIPPYASVTWLGTYEKSDAPDAYRGIASHEEFFRRAVELAANNLIEHARILRNASK